MAISEFFVSKNTQTIVLFHLRNKICVIRMDLEMKKLISFLLAFIYFVFSYSGVLAATNNNIRTNVEMVDGYQYKTVLKHYQPYYIGFVNNNDKPVYFNVKTEIKYIGTNGKEYTFPDNKLVYKKARKRDVGRYCWVALPCAAIGGGVIGITFGVGFIAGIGIAVAGFIPALQAAKYNSKVASNIYIENKTPLSLEPKQYQTMYVFLPKKQNVAIDKIIITNLTLKDSKTFDLTIPLLQGEK